MNKSPHEIKKDVETCMNHPYMDTCNSCRLYKECHGISDHIVKELYDLVLYYESRLAQAERERDAAVRDLEEAVDGHCSHCRNNDLESQCDYNGECYYCTNEDCPCHERNCHWQWRGVCEANTKEE